MRKIIALLLLFSALYNCERDDICAETTATTPKLIIRFYNVANQTATKRVTNLQIQGIDNEEVYQAATSTDSIAIPLKTLEGETSFILHKNYEVDDNDTPDDETDDFVTGNEDILTFTYSPSEQYVSRACGYKTIYENVEDELTDDGDNWIQLILIEDPLTVDNETAAHVQIFH